MSATQGLGGFVEGWVYRDDGTNQEGFTNPAIARGLVCSKSAAGLWELATAGGATHINEFTILDRAKPLNATKWKVFMGQAVIAGFVKSGATATPGKECVISSVDGQIQDRAAEAATKVVGMIKGTPAMMNGDVAFGAITGPNAVYVELRVRREV